jgi:hypothetical protein
MPRRSRSPRTTSACRWTDYSLSLDKPSRRLRMVPRVSLEEWFTTLKFAAVLATGIFGFASLGVDYRGKRGRVTRGGKIMLIGVMASTAIALVSQAIETKLQLNTRKDADARTAEENRQTQALLHEIERAVRPLKPIVSISTSTTYDANNSAIATYATRLREAADNIIKRKSLPSRPLRKGFG